MNIVITKKNMMFIAGVVIIGLIIFLIVRRIRTKSTYTSTDSTTSPDKYSIMSTNLQRCADALQADLIDNSDPSAPAGTNSAAGLAAYATCLSSNVDMYVSNVCPASIPGVTSANCPTGAVCNLPNWQANYTAYNNDLKAIAEAYVSVISGADATTRPIVQAARRADITGATRRYLSDTCTNFYVPATTGLPDPTNIYKAWSNTASTGTTYGFNAANVTMANINKWAKYAGNPTANPPVSSLMTTGSLYTTSPTSGVTFVPALPTGSTVTFPYWALARDFGPGTVLASGTNVPVSFTVGTTSYTVSYTAPATIFP